MKKLEPKQVPQFAALCILSAGTFGYFVVRLVTPSPASAGTHPVVMAVKPTPAASQAAIQAPAKPALPGTAPAAVAATPGTPDDAGVTPPAAGMRDPFVVGYVDPKTAPAQAAPPTAPPALPALKPGKPVRPVLTARLPPAPVGAPAVPMLPGGLTDFRIRPTELAPLPAPKAPALPPPAPAWTVTGVLQSDAEQVAILRNGEARRIVRMGDSVDGVYKVVNVTRSAVLLRHGKTFYQLTLGAAKASAPAASSATFLKPPAPPRPLSSAPSSYPARRPAVSLAQAGRSLIRMARTFTAPGRAALAPPALEHVRQAGRPQDDLRFLGDPAAAPAPGDVQPPQDVPVAAVSPSAAVQNDTVAPSDSDAAEAAK